jgi:hypothetical protein
MTTLPAPDEPEYVILIHGIIRDTRLTYNENQRRHPPLSSVSVTKPSSALQIAASGGSGFRHLAVFKRELRRPNSNQSRRALAERRGRSDNEFGFQRADDKWTEDSRRSVKKCLRVTFEMRAWVSSATGFYQGQLDWVIET